jgi:hypothetical protein
MSDEQKILVDTRIEVEDKEWKERVRARIQADHLKQFQVVDTNEENQALYLDQDVEEFEEGDAWEANNQIIWREEKVSSVANGYGYVDYRNDRINATSDMRNEESFIKKQEAVSVASLLNEDTVKEYVGWNNAAVKDLGWKNEPVKEDWKNVPKRYCGEKLSRRQFVYVIVAIVILLLAAIIIPVFIYSVIPSIIRSKMAKGDALLVNKVVLTNPTDKTLDFELLAAVKPDRGSVQISNITMSVGLRETKNDGILDIIFPADFKLDTGKDEDIDLLGRVKVLDFNIPKDVELEVKLNSNVCWGWFCYSNFDVVIDKSPNASNSIKADNLSIFKLI